MIKLKKEQINFLKKFIKEVITEFFKMFFLALFFIIGSIGIMKGLIMKDGFILSCGLLMMFILFLIYSSIYTNK